MEVVVGGHSRIRFVAGAASLAYGVGSSVIIYELTHMTSYSSRAAAGRTALRRATRRSISFASLSAR